MSIITQIKPQKNQKRVNIYLDEEFAFGLDLETFMKSGLKVNKELTEKEIKEIVKKAEFQNVYDKILKFGSLRPRSKNEYKLWLKKHKVHISLYEELFDRLKRLDFLNDEKFAIWWVEQRQSFRPKSKRILNQELRIKGISKEVVDEVLKEAEIDEKNIAKKLIEKKKYKWEKLDEFTARRKMSDYLAGKGFNWNVIKEVLGN